MKLSEAIRQGAKLRPQAFGGLRLLQIVPVCQNGILGLSVIQETSCALGAAFEAGQCGTRQGKVYEGADNFRGLRPKVGENTLLIEIPNEWNNILSSQANCPQCDVGNRTQRIISHLNDDHRWTREEIALWVERVERTAEWLEESEREDKQLEALEVVEMRQI